MGKKDYRKKKERATYMGKRDFCMLLEDLIVREIFLLMETKYILQIFLVYHYCENLWMKINHLNFEIWSFESYHHFKN